MLLIYIQNIIILLFEFYHIFQLLLIKFLSNRNKSYDVGIF